MAPLPDALWEEAIAGVAEEDSVRVDGDESEVSGGDEINEGPCAAPAFFAVAAAPHSDPEIERLRLEAVDASHVAFLEDGAEGGAAPADGVPEEDEPSRPG